MATGFSLKALVLSALLTVSAAPAFAAACGTGTFEAWLEDFKKEAVAKGISQSAIATSLAGVTLDKAVIARDQNQKVFSQTFEEFSGRMKSGNRAAFFTLEYVERDVLDRLRAIGVEPASFNDLFDFDNSDDICADYIIRKLDGAPRGTLVVIDYLQLLDQKRGNPELMQQVRTLQSFARTRGLIVVFIAQIDRSYDPLTKPFPDLEDIRLPNPLDLTLFSKACFLNNGEVQFRAAG